MVNVQRVEHGTGISNHHSRICHSTRESYSSDRNQSDIINKRAEELTQDVQMYSHRIRSNEICGSTHEVPSSVERHVENRQVGVAGSVLQDSSVWVDPGHPRGRVAVHFTFQHDGNVFQGRHVPG